MTNAQMSARVGVFFVIGIALIWVTFESLSGGKIRREKSYELISEFRTLKELKVGDDVRMAGVKIGSVKSTQLNGHVAQAVLMIDEKVQVRTDSMATIAMAGLLGSNYVSLDLGSETAPFHQPGAKLRSLNTPDLNTLMGQLGDMSRKLEDALGDISGALGGKNGQGLLGKLENLVDENKGKIGEIATNVQEISIKVNKGEGTLARLINDGKLHDELLATVGEIKSAATQAKSFVAQAEEIIGEVKKGQGTLGVLVYDKEAGSNIRTTVQNLREISDKLNKGQGSLGKLINDEELFKQAQGAIKKLDRALDGMSDQAPISAVGAAAGALF